MASSSQPRRGDPGPDGPPPAGALRSALPVLLGHVAALLTVGLFAGLFLHTTHQLTDSSQELVRSMDLLNEADHLLYLVQDAEAHQRGVLFMRESSEPAPHADDEVRRRIDASLDRLRALAPAQPLQRERLDRLEQLVRRELALLERNLALTRAGQSDVALATLRGGDSQRLMQELRALKDKLDTEERARLAAGGERFSEDSRGADFIVLSGSAFLTAFIGLSSLSVVRERQGREREAQRAAENEAHLRRTLKASDVGAWEADLGTGHVLWSSPADSPSGLDSSAAPGTLEAFLALVHPEDRVLMARRLAQPHRAGSEFRLEYRILCADGSTRWHENRGRVLPDDAGQPTRLAGVLLDITSRKRAEQLQGESEERFRLLTEALPQLIWTARPDGTAEYFNPRWFEYTGQTPEQALGEGWSTALHPDDVPLTRERIERALATGQPYFVEYRLRRASDGAWRWFIARGLALRDAQGRITRWFGACTDIDEQKRSTDSLRLLSELSEALAPSLEQATTVQQLMRLTVPTLADWCVFDLVGEQGQVERVAVAHADPAQADTAAVLRRFGPGATPSHPSNQARRLDQTIVFPQVTPELLVRITQSEEHLRAARSLDIRSLVAVPLRARGRTLGVLTFLTTPVSGRRYEQGDVLRLEEVTHRAAMALDNARLFALAQTERVRAEEASRLKDEFLATVSHELRTPLTAMLGWLKLLRDGRLPPARHAHALEIVDRNAHAQAQLVEDLLDVSRIVSGELRLEPRPVHLRHVIQAAMDSLRPAAEARGLRLHVEEGPPGEDRVLGDAGRLRQVVWNLLSNAVKFSSGEGDIWVRLGRVEGGVELRVEDQGPGIPEAFLPHLFERFRQLDGGTTRRYGGLGLGLALVRHLVELHGGTVSATSGVGGQGATFIVRLPASPALPGEALVPGPARPPALAGRHILLVDDARDSRELIQRLLEEQGARVISAASSAEALRVLAPSEGPSARPEPLLSVLAALDPPPPLPED